MSSSPEKKPLKGQILPPSPVAIPFENIKEPEAEILPPQSDLPYGYFENSHGIWLGFEDIEDDDDEDEDRDHKPPEFVCSPMKFEAETCDENNENWGVLVSFKDPKACDHDWAIPREMSAGDGKDMRKYFLGRGCNISSTRKGRDAFLALITGIKLSNIIRCVGRTGWHDNTFVFPDETIGIDEEMVFQTSTGTETYYAPRGTLEQWRENVGIKCRGNSRLIMAASISLSAGILKFSDEDSGGYHMVGESKSGKTTAAHLAGSIWGGGEMDAYIEDWRATSNGLEAKAVAHCDTLFVLDELGQADGKEVGAVCYMLSQGKGKQRANVNGYARPVAKWRVIFFSTGEIDLATKMAEDRGQIIRVGMKVRLVHLKADAGQGLGCFEDLHGCVDGDIFATDLKAAIDLYYGTPSRAFIRNVADDVDHVKAAIRKMREQFINDNVPTQATGQVRVVAARFALAAVAGELASQWDITGWNDGEATEAAARMFGEWLDEWGSTNPNEEKTHIELVVNYLLANKSRMPSRENTYEEKIIKQAGWRDIYVEETAEAPAANEDGLYYLYRGIFKSETCRGYDHKAILQTLKKHGYLEFTKGRLTFSARFPGHKKELRCYAVKPAIFDHEWS